MSDETAAVPSAIETGCFHDLLDMEEACVNGMCPLCLGVALAKAEAERDALQRELDSWTGHEEVETESQRVITVSTRSKAGVAHLCRRCFHRFYRVRRQYHCPRCDGSVSTD